MVPCVILAVVAVKRLDILDDFINVEQSILVCNQIEIILCLCEVKPNLSCNCTQPVAWYAIIF